MKKRINTIIELTVLLALCIGVTLVISKNLDADESIENLGIVPSHTDENGVTVWTFDADMNEVLEENLLAPVRKKYGVLDEPEGSFSRCPSAVSADLSGDTNELYKDGYYFGTMTINIGCTTFEDYTFKVDVSGTTFEIQDASGAYVPVEEWVAL